MIYSESDTNFVGALNLLKNFSLSFNFDKLKLQSNFSSIEWKLLPPSAP